MKLSVDGRTVAEYVLDPGLDRTMSPRPYLHPLTTLRGVVVTDAAPEDHRWHLGLSLAMQDVNGNNLWGGRTYVRDQGYTWLDDHGRISHEGFDEVADDRLVQRLAWRDRLDGVLLEERRVIRASLVDELTWRLELSWELTAPQRVVLGSPATNGRPDGAGYGGCFLRLAPDPGEPRVSEPNGSAAPEIWWQASGYQVKAVGTQRWFVRTDIYPGICAAWAFDQVRIIEAAQTWSDHFVLEISDLG